jgi:hypothetical protein
MGSASPCLKAFMLPGDPLLPFNPTIRLFPSSRIHFPIAVSPWQSNGKVEKTRCILLAVRRATRIANPCVGRVRLDCDKMRAQMHSAGLVGALTVDPDFSYGSLRQ